MLDQRLLCHLSSGKARLANRIRQLPEVPAQTVHCFAIIIVPFAPAEWLNAERVQKDVWVWEECDRSVQRRTGDASARVLGRTWRQSVSCMQHAAGHGVGLTKWCGRSGAGGVALAARYFS